MKRKVRLSNKELEEYIRSNSHLTGRQLADHVGEKRYRVDNCVVLRGLKVKRCRGTVEEIAHRINFVIDHPHWTRGRIAKALGVTSATMVATCTRYQLKTLKVRRILRLDEIESVRCFIESNPNHRRQFYVDYFSFSSTTIGRICNRFGIYHLGMQSEKDLKKRHRKKNRIIKQPSLINNFLMGKL